VVNACVDRLRRHQSRATVPFPEAGPGEPAVLRDAMADRDIQLAVDDALEMLPFEQRAAIILIDVEGYSVADAAQLLGIAEGTVKSRCSRGRARLAVLLGHLRNPDANANVKSAAITVQERGEG